ncbi:MAG: YbgF trimerization domain-containing protein [Allosphingosinicella sp.]
MRFHLIGLVLLAGTAMPALAQRSAPVDQRVDRLEQEMRAVQRRVFPSGRTQFVEPEIEAQSTLPGRPGASGDALSNLNARVDALEAQLRTLTGQVEEQGNQTRQLENQIVRMHAELEGRIERLEPRAGATTPRAGAPAATSTPPAPTDTDDSPAETPDAPPATARSADPAQEAYNLGYRHWQARRYAEAQQTLETAATRYPDSPWTSWMRNLQGRAYLDDSKPATAARIFLANYQDHPRGERAADSLFFLGQSLTRLNRRPEACRVYAELEQVYPTMRDFIRQRLPQARTDARCEAAPSR